MRNNIKYTNQQEQEICQKYSNGQNTVSICEEYNFTAPKLYRILNKNKIKCRGAKTLTKEIVDKLVNLISQEKTIRESCEILKISPCAAGKYLKKRGCKTKQNGHFQRKYTLKEDFLKNIDSSEKAQFLGILFSDGTISTRNKLISLRLEKSDTEYLEKIKKIIDSNKPLFFLKGKEFVSPMNNEKYTRKDTAVLDITNKTFYSYAINAGLLPRKTYLNLGMPKSVPNELKRNFILGVFEGDGCLSWTHKYNVAYISFAGSENMCRDIQQTIKDELNIQGKIKKHYSIFILEYQRYNDIKAIINWLYKNAPFWMERKKTKCEMFLKYLNDKTI